MSSKCSECRKAYKPDDLYQSNFSCSHEVSLCLNCLSTPDTVHDCFNCRSITCLKCKQPVDKNVKSDYQTINFSTCKAKTHSVFICKDCCHKNYAKLVENEISNYCYLCTSSIEKWNLIYYSKELGCKGGHKVKLCGKCERLFDKTRKRCPVCEPFEIGKPLCVACYQPTEDKITILPIACFSSAHKFPICFDCAGNLQKPHLVCKYCNGKESINHVFFQSTENEQDEQCLPSLRFASNTLDPNAIEIDPYVCPTCEPYSVCLNPISDAVKSDQEDWLSPFASVVKFGENVLVSGGIDVGSRQSINEGSIMRFRQDGRIFNFRRNVYTQELKKGRHAHGSAYLEKEKLIFVFGGAQKIKENEIEYLDSIECFDVKDSSANFNGEGEWQTSSTKLKRARCSFAQLRVDNKVVLFGGFSGVNQVENSIEVFDLEKKTVTLVEVQSGFVLPVYPVVVAAGKEEALLIGGFINGESKNQDCYRVNWRNGSVKKAQQTGLQVIDRMRSIDAFGETFIFGGNYFDAKNSKHTGKFKSISSGFEGVIMEGYKNLKQDSVESMKRLLDCFESESIEFNLVR